MKKFSIIIKQAEKRKGGNAELKKLLPSVLSAEELLKVGDDRFLAMMAKAIHQAGFNWSVIEKKWPQFEEAYFGFNVNKLGRLSPEQWEAYMKDVRVVRNWQKIKAVMDNVGFMHQEISLHGSFAAFMAGWPENDQIGLMSYMKKHGSRLGGQTAQWFMRYIGKDCFVVTKDVVLAIQNADIDIADNPTSKRDLKKIQDVMNEWQQQTSLPYAHISKIAACSVGINY